MFWHITWACKEKDENIVICMAGNSLLGREKLHPSSCYCCMSRRRKCNFWSEEEAAKFHHSFISARRVEKNNSLFFSNIFICFKMVSWQKVAENYRLNCTLQLLFLACRFVTFVPKNVLKTLPSMLSGLEIRVSYSSQILRCFIA